MHSNTLAFYTLPTLSSSLVSLTLKSLDDEKEDMDAMNL